MFLHQMDNSIGNDIYNATIYRECDCQQHLHKGFEFIHALNGNTQISVGSKKYVLKKGESLMILPYQIHSLHAQSQSDIFVAVFSGSQVESFARLMQGKEAKDARFQIEKSTLDFISNNLMGVNSETGDYDVGKVAIPDTLTLKSCIYAICAQFYKNSSFVQKSTDNKLFFELLNYIENNYASDISLNTLSGELGYDYRYLSRQFNSVFKVNFKTLVNQYRCEKAKQLIMSTNDTISDIALESGFQSVRSFNRVFLAQTGKKPTDIRRQR